MPLRIQHRIDIPRPMRPTRIDHVISWRADDLGCLLSLRRTTTFGQPLPVAGQLPARRNRGRAVGQRDRHRESEDVRRPQVQRQVGLLIHVIAMDHRSHLHRIALGIACHRHRQRCDSRSGQARCGIGLDQHHIGALAHMSALGNPQTEGEVLRRKDGAPNDVHVHTAPGER
ncbi:Uncharacterised protein [Mycobacteroides abscessus subsp. massiliense]|nr:Uncharacterised protein [Mycobacteroides abscessus subsp. massiliense]